MGKFVSLDEATFEDIFQLIPGPEGDMSWTKEAILDAGIPDSRVWTIVEADDGYDLWCEPGWHSVSVFGYTVSTISRENDEIEGIYMKGDEPRCDHCGTEERDVSGDEWCGECGTCIACCGGHVK